MEFQIFMLKERLFTPGPTTIPLEVLHAMERPVLHHRTDVFKKTLRKAALGVRWLLQSEHDPVFLASSGTGGMEATIRNLCAPGTTIISINAGVFGGRWKKIADRCSVRCTEIVCEPGATVTPEQIRDALKSDPAATLFCVQHCETSTTVLHPIDEILSIVKSVRPELITVVDGISACGTAPLPAQRGLVDVYIAGSQKAFMLPPGLAIVDLSSAAWKAVESTPRTTLYFDFLTERESLAKDTSAWTPPTTILCGLVAALDMFQSEGLEGMFSRHATIAEAVRAGLKAHNLTLMADKHPSPGVTGFYPPAGIDAEAIRSGLKNKFGIRVAGGQAGLTGKVVRIGHMGYIDSVDVIGMMGALELVLSALGADISVGMGTKAAIEVVSQNK